MDKSKEPSQFKKQNVTKKQQQSETLNQLQEQNQSQTTSIDNTIDSILNMISTGPNPRFNQSQSK